jgi:hypothetical protein
VIDLRYAIINTAGAYVCIDGYYVFAIGIKLHNGQIPIVRLGGHREGHETGWQCAVREVYEEANLPIQPLLSQTTYLSDWDHTEELQEIQWRPKSEQEPIPILVVAYSREASVYLSLMYLAHTHRFPTPSSEVKGLLLLKEEEIHRLCHEPMTLEQYLHEGGRAILHAEFDTSLFLEPFVQLRLLSRILRMQSTSGLHVTYPKPMPQSLE